MTIVGSSTSASVASGTSLTFTLAASVGDLLVVALACDAPRNIIPPSNYNPGVADSWVPLTRGMAQDNGKLNLYTFYKTVNATDASTGVYTFNSTFASDPSNSGENFPTMNAVGVMAKCLSSSSGNAGLDVVSPQGYLRGTRSPFQLPLLTGTRLDRFMTATALLGPSASTITHGDPLATLVQSSSIASGNGLLQLSLYFTSAQATKYPYTVAITNPQPTDVQQAVLGLADASSTWLYTAPFVREGIPAGSTSRLMERYPYHEGFTVVNAGGIFKATRFYSQDQLAAATQTFTGTQQVTATDRTNILNASCGGDFRLAT